MTLDLRLLGSPEISGRGGARPLAGWKPWGLLAYLVLEGRPVSRTELAALLWPTADDPGAALRWALVQVRRSLRPEAQVGEERGQLFLDPDAVRVDALQVLSGRLDPGAVEEGIRGDLLEGMHFAGAPLFELWLEIQRARIGSAARETFRWAATLAASTDLPRAHRLIAQSLARDPFDDAAHELLVEFHALQGDWRAAEGHARRVDDLYRTELGIEAPSTIRRPLERSLTARANPLVDRTVAARAALVAARARFDAGDYDSAISAARRAATDAAAGNDESLEVEALVLLSSLLIHSLRGLDHEAVGLLDRALRLATRLTDPGLVAEIEREAGYVAYLQAEYGAAEAALQRSIALARSAGDVARVGRALTILGSCQTDRSALDAASATLSSALAALDSAGDRRWHAYALSQIARLRLLQGRPAEAAEAAAASVADARAAGWLSLVPFPMALGAEGELAIGGLETARAAFGEAFALACEIGDPCWEGLSLRGLSLTAAADGDHERAGALLGEALLRCRRLPDTYRWAEALILTDIVEFERGRDRGRLEEARALVRRAPMPALSARLDRFPRSQTLGQTPHP